MNRVVMAAIVAAVGFVLLAGDARAADKRIYDEVSQVMKSVFTGGNLEADSPAVKHAADVDMPARGGTPRALKKYLSKADVKKWYCDNFQLK